MTTTVTPPRPAGTALALKPPVTILDDYGHVDKDLVHISKTEAEEVQWINNGKDQVDIVFEESPFAKPRFQVAAGQTTPSGLPTAPAGDKRYKYTVIGSKGNHDPAVIINH